MMYFICALITAISAAVSLGFALQTYQQAKSQPGPTLTNAQYALSRSLALAIVACGLLVDHSQGYLIALAVTMIGVQLFDGLIGLKISLFKTLGPLLTAGGNAICLALWLLLK